MDQRAPSTTEREGLIAPKVAYLLRLHWSRRWDSNPRPTVYETVALPLSYVGATLRQYTENVGKNKPADTRVLTPSAPAWVRQHTSL